MTTFKIGDKLRVVSVDTSGEYYIGYVGTVSRTKDHFSGNTYCLDGKDAGLYGHRFELIVEKTVVNGVDGNGKALNFSESDLQPFMRVTDQHGKFSIVVEHPTEGKIRVCSDEMWNSSQTMMHVEDGYPVQAVYAAPSTGKLLSFDHRGKLLWKRCTKTAQQLAQEKAVKELEDSIKASQEKLEQLKRSM